MGRKIGIFGLVNYRRHPEDKNYVVFNFNSAEEADLFECILVKEKIWHEKDTEEDAKGILYLFAIQEGSLDAATAANGVVAAKFKQGIFSNKILKLSLVGIFALLVVFAVIGYVKNSGNPVQKTNQTENDSL